MAGRKRFRNRIIHDCVNIDLVVFSIIRRGLRPLACNAIITFKNNAVKFKMNEPGISKETIFYQNINFSLLQ